MFKVIALLVVVVIVLAVLTEYFKREGEGMMDLWCGYTQKEKDEIVHRQFEASLWGYDQNMDNQLVRPLKSDDNYPALGDALDTGGYFPALHPIGKAQRYRGGSHMVTEEDRRLAEVDSSAMGTKAVIPHCAASLNTPAQNLLYLNVMGLDIYAPPEGNTCEFIGENGYLYKYNC